MPNSYSSKVYSLSGLSTELREHECRPSRENWSQMTSNLWGILLPGCRTFHRLSLHFSHFSYFLEMPSEITSALPIRRSSVGLGEMLSLMKGPISWHSEDRGSSCLLPSTGTHGPVQLSPMMHLQPFTSLLLQTIQSFDACSYPLSDGTYRHQLQKTVGDWALFFLEFPRQPSSKGD